jgi:hypothetical protein
MPPVKTGPKPALVHQAKVLDVNIANWTLSVWTEFTKKPLTDIPFSVPYTHANNGEGIYFMPEVGSTCWLCETSDGSKSFVLGWGAVSVDGPGQFRGHRQDLNPGDIWLGTRDENFLVLRRGGVVQIGGTGLCQRLFLPINNTIKDFCENYGLHTLGGDLSWEIAPLEKVDGAILKDVSDTSAKRPALFRLAARELAGDPNPIAFLEIGSHDGDSKTILTLTINESGADGAALKIGLKMDKEGNVSWVLKKDLTYKVEGKVTISIKDDVTVSTEKKFTLEVKDKISVKGKGVDIDAGGDKVTVKSDMVATMTLKVGQAMWPVVLATPAFMAFLNHVHPTTLPGAPTSTPLPPCSGVEAVSLKSD